MSLSDARVLTLTHHTSLFLSVWLFTIPTCTLFWTGPASAEVECGSRPWIAVHFSASRWPDGFRETVVADLQASLGERGIDVCPARTHSRSRALARITLSASSAEMVHISVVAREEDAQRRVARDVELSTVPRDGRAFAIALATDELISASWEQLELLPSPGSEAGAEDTAPESAAAGDQSVAETRFQAPGPSTPPDSALGVFAMAEFFESGRRYLGAEVRVRIALGETFADAPWAVEAGLAGAVGNVMTIAGFGDVTSDAQVVGLWLRYALSRSRSLGFGASAGTRLGTYSFAGTPAGVAQAADRASGTVSAPFWSGEFKLDTDVQLAGPVFFSVALSVAIPIVDVEARVQGQPITAASRFVFNPSVGLFLQW